MTFVRVACSNNNNSEDMTLKGAIMGGIGDENKVDVNHNARDAMQTAPARLDVAENDEDVDDEKDGGDDEEEEDDNDEDEECNDDEGKVPLAARSGPVTVTPRNAMYPLPANPYYPPGGSTPAPLFSALPYPSYPKTRRRGGVVVPFPEKLHEMLETCAEEGLWDVVSFFPHGRAFAIHKPRRFVEQVMPRFFKQTKLTSFQRQLNLYGFNRIADGPDNGGYYHKLFLRGRPELCASMKRFKVKSKIEPQKAEPDFYSYPEVMSAYGSGGRPLGYPPIAPVMPPPPPYTISRPYVALPPGNQPLSHAPYNPYASTSAAPPTAQPLPTAPYSLIPQGYMPHPYHVYPAPHCPPPASTGHFMPHRPKMPLASPVQLTGHSLRPGAPEFGVAFEGVLSPLKSPSPTKADN